MVKIRPKSSNLGDVCQNFGFLVHFYPFITTQKNGYIFFKIVFALTNIYQFFWFVIKGSKWTKNFKFRIFE